ncbi:OLC1v1022443C2 [Oldenlandia corymbosa var. corymbosa]|nr:OLC1v1022443C2 [Oldenlandia corymbosa var. corymbosa]
MASRRNIPYSRLPTYEDEDYEDDVGIGKKQRDARFDYSPKSYDRVPWKSILLALFLLSLGCLLLFLAFFILTGHMGGESSQAYGLLGLGFLTFLPG